MPNNALMNQFGWGGGGGMQGGFPSFSQYNSWASQMPNRQQPQQQPYQVGQNKPIDSNAGFRTDPNVNYTPVNPYGMNQSNQNSWTGNGWTSNRGTPVPADQLGGYMQNMQKMQQQGQSERPQQQWNPGPTTGTQTPYQIKPGGSGPISMDPRSGLQPWANNGGRAPWDMEPPRGGPETGRPRFSTLPGTRPPNDNNGWGPKGPPSFGPRPRPNLAPGQQQYNGHKIVPMTNTMTPIGPGGPTRQVPGFNPGGQMPYRPQAWGQQSGMSNW